MSEGAGYFVAGLAAVAVASCLVALGVCVVHWTEQLIGLYGLTAVAIGAVVGAAVMAFVVMIADPS